MVKSSQFRTKLRQCDPEIRQYIATLESHNLKLQRQLGRLEANNITAINRIKALEKTLNEDMCIPAEGDRRFRRMITAVSDDVDH